VDDIEKKREELKKLYPKSKGWVDRVNRMSAAQVTAVYLDKKAKGKLGK
jgi:hypothetical protein